MSLSMYDTSVPVFIRMLGNLAAILRKGATSAEARSIDPVVLTGARLAPDMLPLTRQVQIACDAAKGGAARLAGVEIPAHADVEVSFPELQARIDATIAFLNTVKPEQLEDAETRSITLKVQGADLVLPGQMFLLNFVMPNFYFHISTAYDILRHNGVSIGKRDLLGAV
jgi:hypothetical protein